jgi:protein-tyrosine phosphatase
MSVTGDFGRRPQADTWALLEAGLVHFLASDAHNTRRRPPGLRRAYDLIASRWGEPAARRLAAENPRAVVEDRPLPEVV